jgi:Palmitoyl protein thioesterase
VGIFPFSQCTGFPTRVSELCARVTGLFPCENRSTADSAGTFHDYDDIVSWLKVQHPGQVIIPLDINNGVVRVGMDFTDPGCQCVVGSQESMKPMWTQVNETTALIQSLIAANQSIFASGYHFLGHSQGGLMMRSVIQNFDNHNVHTFVSMAGVQLGV